MTINQDILDKINSYTDDDIINVEPMKHIFIRPSNYLGSLSNPNHTLEEAIMNSMDEVKEGVADTIWIDYYEDGSVSVKDNGRGIPPEYSDKFDMPTVRFSLTVPNTGKGLAELSSGSSQHGLGMKATVATSDWFEVEVYRNGYRYYDRYELQYHDDDPTPAVPTVKLKNGKNLPKTKTKKGDLDHGTFVRWLPSDAIWDSIRFDWNKIIELSQGLAYINPGLKIILNNHNNGDIKEFHEERGMEVYLESLLDNNTKLITPIYNFKSTYESNKGVDIEADVYFAWSDSNTHKEVLYTNNVPNPHGGTPVKGFHTGISRVINKYASDLKMSKSTIQKRDIIPGLYVIISMTHPKPEFDGQTKKEIMSSDADLALNWMVYNNTTIQFDRTVEQIKTIIQNALRREDERKKKQEGSVNLKSKDAQRVVSDKLSPCRKTGEKSELFIVEGDSAGGTLINERDTNYQAVMPIRGKIINALKASTARSMDNKELQTIFATIGTGIGDDFDMTKLKYGKIIIATDADPDGAAISCLLLTALLEFAPELVREGYVYRVLTPLFLNQYKNGDVVYTYDNKEQEELLKKKNAKNIVNISRNKGLGELTADIVEETIINHDTRKLIQFKMDEDNEESVEEVVNAFMGSNVAPRKEIFFNEGMYAKDLS